MVSSSLQEKKLSIFFAYLSLAWAELLAIISNHAYPLLKDKELLSNQNHGNVRKFTLAGFFRNNVLTLYILDNP